MKVIQIKKDPIFLHLLWLNYLHNYRINKTKAARVLTENHALYSILLIKDLPEVERYTTKKLAWQDFDFDNLAPFFLDKKDGAFIVSGSKISNKQIIDKIINLATKKLKMSTEKMLTSFLPQDYFCVGSQCLDLHKEIGSRSLFGLSAALLGDDSTAVYKLGQTIYGCATGKLSKITNQGLAIDAYFERYSVTKFKILNDFNCFTYKQPAKISMHYDVLVIKFYHLSEKSKQVKLLGEFLIKPRELDDYYNSRSTNLRFYKKHEIVNERKGAKKLGTVFDIVGLDRLK